MIWTRLPVFQLWTRSRQPRRAQGMAASAGTTGTGTARAAQREHRMGSWQGTAANAGTAETARAAQQEHRMGSWQGSAGTARAAQQEHRIGEGAGTMRAAQKEHRIGEGRESHQRQHQRKRHRQRHCQHHRQHWCHRYRVCQHARRVELLRHMTARMRLQSLRQSIAAASSRLTALRRLWLPLGPISKETGWASDKGMTHRGVRFASWNGACRDR